jgi:lipopolysaccharide/colanic/teichoic acid biosynthesis glycosyltransferase
MKHLPSETFTPTAIRGSATLQSVAPDDTQGDPVWHYYTAKRIFDLSMSILLLPVFILTSLILLVVNPSKNKGPLFYVQTRMGKNCDPFQAIKFRSMTVTNTIERGANDPLETHRITRLGDFLRRSRLDEVPQIINVFKGEMSLVGPRPDYIEHAKVYVDTIPGYTERHAVRPGISGFAQTEVGYAEGIEATRVKVEADLQYIKNRTLAFEAWIVWRTLQIVIKRGGA